MVRLTAAGAIGLILAVVAWTLADPKVVLFVSPGDDAPWVRVDRPFTSQPFGDASVSSDFRKDFELKQPVSDVRLRIATPYEAKVFLDDRPVREWVANRDDWKEPRDVSLGDIAPGRHRLIIVAVNQWGANALSVECDSLPELSTAAGWEGTELKTGWKPVVSVDERPLTEVASKFPTSPVALGQLWPVVLGVVLIVVVGSQVVRRRLDSVGTDRVLQKLPDWIRWGSLAAFVLVAINNLSRGWFGDGFDYYGHTDYVTFVATQGSLPLPKDGLQMFQSPLYYVVGALLVKVLSLFMSAATAMRWLVLINLACGLAQIEICARALKAVFPDRPVARSMGMLAGCLLPMNVYFSHYVGNQAFEGVFTALALMLTVQYLAASEWASGKQLTLMGAVIGLALLAKVNAVVPAALIVAALMIRSVFDQRSAWLTGEDLFFLVSPILVLAGWYYFRNWLNFGRPFLGGWGADAAFKWWQDRGFNSPRDLWSFGMGIVHPVYAGFGSLWDGFYSSMWLDAHLGGGDSENRPRWNDRFMVSSALIGILPTIAMLMGGVIPFVRRRDAGPALLFASTTSFALMGAYIAYNLRNPCFASTKAFYTIGGLPCFAILAGLGLETLMQLRWLRPVIVGAIACVPVWSVASYFLVR
jgi:hypothetical protein